MSYRPKCYDLLDSIYLSRDGLAGSFGSAKRLHQIIKSKNLGLSQDDINRYLENVRGYSRHARVLRKFPKRMFLAKAPFDYWQCDVIYLSEMKNITHRKVRNRPDFALTAIDLFTKQGYAQEMTRKRPEDTVSALKKILSRAKGQPALLQTDAGGEFSAAFAAYCKSIGIKLFMTSTLQKCAQVENFNGQIKLLMNRQKTHYNSNDPAKFLQNSVKIYNNQISSGLPNLSPNMAGKMENIPLVQQFCSLAP